MAIRLAKPDDLDGLHELELSCFASESFSRRQMKRLFGSKNAIFLVYEETNVTLGFAIGLIRNHRSDATGRLYSLDVAEAARGKGIGKLLLDALEARFKSLGISRIYLEVTPKNERAVGLYLRRGYEKKEVIKNYYKDGSDAIRMMKEIV